MEDITLLILKDFSLLSFRNPNGSAVEIRLTNSQLAYIEEKINFSHKLQALKAGN